MELHCTSSSISSLLEIGATCGERGRTSASGHAACPHFRWATDDTVQRAKRSAAKCRSHETSPRFHCVTSQSLAAVLKTLRGRARPRVSYAPSSAHSPIPHRRHAAVLHLSKTPHFFAMAPGSHFTECSPLLKSQHCFNNDHN